VSGRIVVGTSSWADPGFVEEWYPAGLPARHRLPYYAERFEAVEVNATFYAIPAESTVSRWVTATPDGFTFDVKLHRLLSRHSAGLDSLPKALRAGAKTSDRGRVLIDEKLEARLLAETLAATEPLADAGRLGAFLLQLTPGFAPRKHDLDELLPVLEGLRPHPVAIELRHRAWVDAKRVDETLAWYEQHRAVWVGVDAPAGEQITIMPPVDAATHPDVAYLRAHGRNHEGYVKGRSVAERFAYRYDDGELAEIGARAESLAEQVGESVRVYFNNNRGDDAPVAAQRFLELAATGSRASGNAPPVRPVVP
jgi:uncharacterized protein YecE (DUF72 family)